MDDGSYAPSYEDGKKLWAIGAYGTSVLFSKQYITIRNRVLTLICLGLGLVSVEPPQLATRLQDIELSYVPENECRELARPVNLGEATICATYQPGNGDACNGDSGGPLFDKENQVVVGLTSYGDARCESYNPGKYARVADKVSWLFMVILLYILPTSKCHTACLRPFLYTKPSDTQTYEISNLFLYLTVVLDQRYYL